MTEAQSPEHLHQQQTIEKLRAELKKITDRLVADLERRLGLDKSWTRRGRS